METRTADALHARYSALKSQRTTWDTLHQELARYYLPDRACFYNECDTRKNAETDRSLIYDSTGEDAVNILAASLQGLLMNPQLAWFSVRLQGAEKASDDVKKFLADCRDYMLAAINSDGTGFNVQAYELCLDVSALNTACMYVEEDDETVMRFECIPVSAVVWAESARGLPDTVFHRMRMSARQIVQRWPDHNIQDVKGKLEKEPDAQFTVIHCVQPRGDAAALPGQVATKERKPFASWYYEEGSKQILEEGGYDEMPYLIVRWSKASGDVMGRGPSQAALPDVRMLNKMSMTQMMAAEKMADPPLMVPDDGFLGAVNTGPGGLSYYRANTQDRIEPLPVAVDIAATEAMLEQRRQAVRRIMLADQLMSPESPTMTATQFLQLVEERYRVLGPTLGRFQTEYLSPLINRVFHIMLRAGALPEIPDSLAGKDLVVEYVNPVSRNQRAADARAMSQAVEFMAPLIGKDDPFGVLDNFDVDAIARDTESLFGYPAKYLRDPKKVEEMRAQKAQAAQAAQQIEAANAMADTAQKAAGAKMDGPSALTAVTGGMA